MKNRLLAVLLAALLVAVPVTYFSLTSADATDVIPAYEDVMSLIGQDDLIAPLAASSVNVSYYAYPFQALSPGGSLTTYVAISPGQHYEYSSGSSSGNAKNISCGVRVDVPANSKSGYYTFVGFFPSLSNPASYTTTGWYPRNDAICIAPSNIVLSATPAGGMYAASTSSYTSTIYIPAHTSNVSVWIMASIDPSKYANKYFETGGSCQTGAFVSFVADEHLSDILNAVTSHTGQMNTAINNQTASVNNTVNSAKTALAEAINSGFDKTVQALADIDVSSPFSEFEDRYVENFQAQLEAIEQMLSPENTALPNGGDIAGFVSDVQDGLGISGSSFSASAFKEATSKFGSASATGSGGPWEFFSQAVADSLAGDTSSVGLVDDDYIYAWLDEMQRRYGLWSSSSP